MSDEVGATSAREDGATVSRPVPSPDADVFAILPARDTLPEEYRRYWHSDSNPWCALVNKWFHIGLSTPDLASLLPKPGVDKDAAMQVLNRCMRSWGPAHEHKIGGCAFLMSEWFTRAEGAEPRGPNGN